MYGKTLGCSPGKRNIYTETCIGGYVVGVLERDSVTHWHEQFQNTRTQQKSLHDPTGQDGSLDMIQ